jgi:hypothetical protein
MKVEYHAPFAGEAEVDYDKAKGTLSVEPMFMRGARTQTVGYLEVKGDKGKVLRYVLLVNSRSGRLTLNEPDTSPTHFDGLSENEPVREADKKVAAK